ncbi:MAG: hypothetical protein CFE36_01565 [Sphingomonadaceae bacterium PASS1]|nr:MAG: hypothetical protein CFE36_01565 [Sphingomonadaceae bacterium PASS1]
MVVSTPAEVNALIRVLKPGEVITLDELRNALARRHNTTVACPVSTAIFVNMSARAAEENRAIGMPDAELTPYWRVLKKGGFLNPKYPGGTQQQSDLLAVDGVRSSPLRKKLAVFDYEARQPLDRIEDRSIRARVQLAASVTALANTFILILGILMFPIDYRTLIGAFITWLVPLFVSFGLFDPATQFYVPGFVGFKIIMILTVAAVTFFTYCWIARHRPLVWGMAAVYLAINSLLDLLVLILLFKVPIESWLMTILPIYIVIFFAIMASFQRRALGSR